ncbi:MAG: PAS domain S-box protein [Methanomicrobiales archaeon]|nr:PAS domain S-box protein [Methanomicrobiales archaeon]
MTETGLESENIKPISILFVDDEPEILNITKIFLEETGDFVVDTITSAVDALKSSPIQSYDAIVSDYLMPDMDGIAFLKIIREEYGYIPFILFIGHGCEEIVIEAINNGADFYLQKSGTSKSPFAELAYRIKQAVKKKRAEEKLRKSEEKFRSFVENANEIVFSLNPDGTFSYISPNCFSILGHNPIEIIGKSSKIFIHPDDLQENLKVFNMAIKNGESATGVEYRIQHKNGNYRWHSQSIVPVRDINGNIVGVQGICHDITGRKKIEAALRKANRQLNLLTSITRHDILNKITTIYGYLEIAEMEVKNHQISEYLQKMKETTKEIQSQIEFTSIYENLGVQEPQWITLETALPHLSIPSSVSIIAEVKNIDIFADPMLEKVFFNLFDNSLRHGKNVSTIRITTHQSGDNLVIIWEDNGIGVSDEEKDNIFEPGIGANTGFGMFLVREILLLTGIRIRETGVYGKGARFEIMVPKAGWKYAQNQ